MKKIDTSTKTHPNRFTLVDDEDFNWLNQWKWRTEFARGKKYVCRSKREGFGTRMHRVILKAKKGEEIDHIDGDGLNNQKVNLRFCTHAENMRNRDLQKNNTSGYKGVSWSRKNKKWQAHIKYKGKQMGLGLFFCLIKAAAAYDEAAKKLYGKYARINFQKG